MLIQCATEIVIHLSLPLVIIIAAKLTIMESLILILGAFLIDIDHLFYIFIREKIFSIKKIVQWGKTEYSLHRPHFFVFHTIEVLCILIILGYLTNRYLFLFFMGFVTNLLMDAVTYIYFYRSWKPWAKYFSIIWLLKSKRVNEPTI